MCPRTSATSARVAFGNAMETICLSAWSPSFVAATSSTKLSPNAIASSETEMSVTIGAGLGGESTGRNICGRNAMVIAKYAAAPATAMAATILPFNAARYRPDV
ncbi:hypothetical protein [Candidatus Nitrososphaera sp. FF02]|uniref:hypothetical protein n=1 Tax=Candidatus Nitrososphaera sp. FF02 TaxID=3398226 RepID=UPI0039E8F5A4